MSRKTQCINAKFQLFQTMEIQWLLAYVCSHCTISTEKLHLISSTYHKATKQSRRVIPQLKDIVRKLTHFNIFSYKLGLVQ